MNEIVITTLSPAEVELINNHRAETARRTRIDELAKALRSTLQEIKELGGSVDLPTIGGKYVYRHNPRVTAQDIIVHY